MGQGVLAAAAALKDSKKLAEIGIREGIGFIPFAGAGWDVFKLTSKKDASPVRADAAAVLAKDPDPQTTRALVNATGDTNSLVRSAALEALAKRGDPSVLETIQLYLPDQEGGVKYIAAAAILQLSATGSQERPPRQQR